MVHFSKAGQLQGPFVDETIIGSSTSSPGLVSINFSTTSINSVIMVHLIISLCTFIFTMKELFKSSIEKMQVFITTVYKCKILRELLLYEGKILLNLEIL